MEDHFREILHQETSERLEDDFKQQRMQKMA
jgi:hypothetical protein